MSGNPLICAIKLDGKGGGEALSWGQLTPTLEEGEFTWLHFDRTVPETRTWLEEDSEVDGIVIDALLADETRPRCVDHAGGILLNLRGVNLNPDADPEDMVSIRLWITATRIISVRRARLMAVQDIRDAVDAATGPATPGQFVVMLADRLLMRIGDKIGDIEDEIDELEDQVLVEQRATMRGQLANLRRLAITYRRHIAPQREALSRLTAMDLEIPFITPRERNRIREAYDSVSRQVENLDDVRERASVIQEELTTRQSETMNQKLYVLSVAAAIFLPLNLVAGMLGMNVAGLPGVKDPSAFFIVTVFLIVAGIAEYIIMRWLKWI